MEYFGEHLLPGRLGHFFLLLSLVSSLGATISYFLSVQKNRVNKNSGALLDSLTVNDPWKNWPGSFLLPK